MLYQESFRNIPNLNLDAAKNAAAALRAQIRGGEIAPIQIIHEQRDLAELKQISEKILRNFEEIVILGTGGSSLAGRAFAALSFKSDKKIYFLDSIDPNTVSSLFERINPGKTFFLAISKSGETIETVAQTLIAIEWAKNQKLNLADKFLFVTESKTNSLAKIAASIGADIVDHPQNIGGRFSAFSIVGCLPALLASLDPSKIRNGARQIVESFLNETDESLVYSTATQLKLYELGYKSLVIMPYQDQLAIFNLWCRQLIAESLGKNGFGFTPIDALGTIDQHSQIQLYADGPRDKFFTFITQKKYRSDIKLNSIAGSAKLLNSKTLAQITNIEGTATIDFFDRKKLPLRIIELSNILDEEILGGLMMKVMLEVILIAKVLSIDPFDQDAVEERKKLAISRY